MAWFSRKQPPAPAPAPSTAWTSIGVVFDIDALLEVGKRERNNDYNYGIEARRHFVETLDPGKVGVAFLFDGDTNATLNGDERHYCIALAAEHRHAIEVVRTTFGGSSFPGLAPMHARFIAQPIVIDVAGGEPRVHAIEPLPLWMAIGADGAYVISRPVPDDVWLCHKFGRRFRLGDTLQSLLERLPDGDRGVEALTSSSLSYEEIYTLLVAADPKTPGIPRALSKLLEHYRPQRSDHYWVAMSRLDKLSAFPAADIAARPDARDVLASMMRAGQYLLEDGEHLDGAAEFFDKVAECAGAGSALQQEAQALAKRSRASDRAGGGGDAS